MAELLLEAINAGELDTALSLFDINAVVSVDGMAPISGRQEIQVWLERLKADSVKLGELDNDNQKLDLDENRFSADYVLNTARASKLGIESLTGTGEITTWAGRITTLSFTLSEESRAELLRGGAPVLSYAVLTDPDPLRASPGGTYDPNLASLTVVITNDTEDSVLVGSITLRLPEGSTARDLTPNISGINSEAPDTWNITKQEGRFNLLPVDCMEGKLEKGEGLFITFSQIQINDKPGVWGLEIVEMTGEIVEETGEIVEETCEGTTKGIMTIQMAKFPFVLYVSDLAADPLIIDQGGSTTLSWEGSDGATYKLHYGDTIIDDDLHSVDSYTVDNLTQTTTFYLTVTLVGGEDLPPLIRERTVTVK